MSTDSTITESSHTANMPPLTSDTMATAYASSFNSIGSSGIKLQERNGHISWTIHSQPVDIVLLLRCKLYSLKTTTFPYLDLLPGRALDTRPG